MELPILKHLALVLFVTLVGTTQGHAMGSSLPTATEQTQMRLALENTVTEPSGQVCAKPITAVETGRISCPIKTPGQVVGEALKQQLCGGEVQCWDIEPFTGNPGNGWTISPEE